MPGQAGDTLAGTRSRGVALSAIQKGDAVRELDLPPSLISRATLWSYALRDTLAETLPQETAALAAGLLLGDTNGLTDRQALNLRDAGMSHAVSVSGLHIAFLIGFLLFVFGNRRWAFWPAIPVLLLFVAMAGFPASAIRAAIMQFMLLLSYRRGLAYDSFTALSAALLVILLFNPFAAADVGLQLSFSATLGILLFTRKIDIGLTRLLLGRHDTAPDTKIPRGLILRGLTKLRKTVVTSLAVTFSALSLSTVLLALYFDNLSLISPLSNLLLDRKSTRLNSSH